MAKNFLDFEGLQAYDAKLKEWVRRQGSASATPADWNEKDPTSKSFIANKPFEEIGSGFSFVSVHLADGEGHEGEIENDDTTNAVKTVTPADNLIYVGESTGWPATEFDHIIWSADPDTTAEGRFSSMYFYGPTLDLSELIHSVEEWKSYKANIVYNGTSYSLPLIQSSEDSYYVGQKDTSSDEYIYEYPFRIEINIETNYNEDTGEDELDFSNVSFVTYLLCKSPFDIDISFGNKEIIKLDNKYINTAQSIQDNEQGFTTGDQVYDATMVTIDLKTFNVPETIGFAEINPGTGHSSDIITSYV